MSATDPAARPASHGVAAWARRHRRALGVGGAVLATGMAVLWTVVVPDRAAEVDGLQELAIRWGHPATWALLAVLGVLVATDAPKGLQTAVGWASLGCYAAFLLALNL